MEEICRKRLMENVKSSRLGTTIYFENNGAVSIFHKNSNRRKGTLHSPRSIIALPENEEKSDTQEFIALLLLLVHNLFLRYVARFSVEVFLRRSLSAFPLLQLRVRQTAMFLASFGRTRVETVFGKTFINKHIIKILTKNEENCWLQILFCYYETGIFLCQFVFVK